MVSLQKAKDVYPLLRMWIFAQQAKVLPKEANLAFCYSILNKVSRSFAIVTQQLPADLRNTVCVFYLVLRALDTVEDDMAIPVETKVPVLRAFYKHIYDRKWTMKCGYGEYVALMDKYPAVTDVFLRLPKAHQKVIEDIARRMGQGMAEFIEREVKTVADYDKYCYYVAGLVGIGLSQLWAASGHESKEFANMEELSVSMGLFLQKTNIIRDYLEDILEEPAPRMFWPREVWHKYADRLEDFKEPANAQKAVHALNELVTDALRHAKDSLAYMAKLKDREVFKFCAVPQVMAIATLAEIYNNPKVFTGVVKVRRSVVAKVMLGTENIHDLERAFLHYSQKISQRCKSEALDDPSSKLTLQRTEQLTAQITQSLQSAHQPLTAQGHTTSMLFRLAILALGTLLVAQSILGSSPFASAALQLILLLPVVLIAAIFVYSSSQPL